MTFVSHPALCLAARFLSGGLSFMRHALIIACLALTGCCWFSGKPLPEPATDSGLSGAESTLDHLTDKRDSRVSAAVAVAKEHTQDRVVGNELAVAQAMLPSPAPDDLAFARDRADHKDDAFYAKQVQASRDLAAALVKANADYEREKARKQAEYDAKLKEKEMALAAEQEARQSDKWTYAGIALVTIGLLGAVLSPMKRAFVGIAVSGIIVGDIPRLLRQEWFGYGVAAIIALSVLGFVLVSRLKIPAPDEPTPPQG